ncbi:MAG: SulP family inorganic anion transporter [Candidatus Saccharimonas sp.]
MQRRFIPKLTKQRRVDIKHDVVAGVVVTAIAIPESLGYAAIVGLPLETGLYSALFAPLVFALLASSRRLIIGADSATAALIASGAGLVAATGTAGYANAIAVLGLLVGLILIAMALLRLDFLANLISRPVLIGFLAGVGVQLMLGKLPEMVGASIEGGWIQQLGSIAGGAASINSMSVTIAILVVGIMIVLQKTRYPAALIALVSAAAFSSMFQLSRFGVEMIGSLPTGLPDIVLPYASLDMVITMLPTALSIALVILVQSSMVIRNSAGEHDEPVNLQKDMFALGFANATAALTRGFSVNGSPPRTVAADLAGGSSKLTGVVMSVLIAISLLFAGSLFAYIPKAALAAVVFMIGWRLVHIQELWRIWQTHRAEFVIALIALGGVALFGVREGILFAIIVALAERLSRQYHPKDEVLLRDGELSDWAQQRIDKHYRYRSSPDGVLVYRFDGSLFFENIEYFNDRIRKAITEAKEPVNSIIIDAGAINTIDYTAVEAMKRLHRYLSMDDIRLCFSHVPPGLRQQFDSYGLSELIGEQNMFLTLHAAIDNQANAIRSVDEMVQRLDLTKKQYVVIGGGVLEALGIRTTVDTDLVVDDETYAYYRDEKGWHEYIQDNGKHILSHHGYTMMRSWMGKNLRVLREKAFVKNGVQFMDIDELMACKRRLGRRKDIADIALIEAYLKKRK